MHLLQQLNRVELFLHLFVGLLEDFPVEHVVLSILMDRDFLLELVGQNVKQTVTDLGLCDERRNVINFELGSRKLVVHLLYVLLQFLSELLELLQAGDFLLVFDEYFRVLLELHGLFAMKFSVVLHYEIDVFYSDVDAAYTFVGEEELLFVSFEMVLYDFSVFLDFCAQVVDHFREIVSQLIYVVALQFYLFRDPLPQTHNVSQHLAALLHSDV